MFALQLASLASPAQPAPLAAGPAMYFGSTVMSFALPLGGFIAVATALFLLFRTRHSGPRLRWSADGVASLASVTTREPGPALAPEAIAATAAAVAAVAPDRLEEDVLAEQAVLADPASGAADPTTETAAEPTEGKDGGGE